MKLYPINLNVHNQLCLIIGGGSVAARKIGPLLSCGARVKIISPKVCSAIQVLAEVGDVVWRARNYQNGDLVGAFLAFAATDDGRVQDQVAQEASEKGILLNSIDSPQSCSFQVPARVRRGDFLLTISTGGGSPALAARLRKELEVEFGPEYGKYVDLLSRIREKVIVDGDSSESHKLLFEKLLHVDILTQIRDENWAALRHELQGILMDDVDIEELINTTQF